MNSRGYKTHTTIDCDIFPYYGSEYYYDNEIDEYVITAGVSFEEARDEIVSELEDKINYWKGVDEEGYFS